MTEHPRIAELKDELRSALRAFWNEGEKFLRWANRRTGLVMELAERDRRLDDARRAALEARLGEAERTADFLAASLDRWAGRIRELEDTLEALAPRPKPRARFRPPAELRDPDRRQERLL